MRLEDMCMSSVGQACSAACTKLEQEECLTGPKSEDPSTAPDVAPVLSNSQVWKYDYAILFIFFGQRPNLECEGKI